MYAYDEYMPKLLAAHSQLWGAAPEPVRLSAGFTNTVFTVGKFILKICHDPANEADFRREGEFLLLHGGDFPFVPQLYACSCTRITTPFYYEILERIDGAALYSVWPELRKSERQRVIDTLGYMISELHMMKGAKLDWRKINRDAVSAALDAVGGQRCLSGDDLARLRALLPRFDGFFGEAERAVFIHNDLHFDNLIYDRGTLKLIDFERSRYAPPDMELDILLRMCREPAKFAGAEFEPFVRREDYEGIEKRLRKACRELFEAPRLNERLAVYELIYELRQLARYPENAEIKERVMSAALLIEGE